MKDKREQEIKEMGKFICKNENCFFWNRECISATPCGAIVEAKQLYNAGYRKQSEVAKEIINKIGHIEIGTLSDFVSQEEKDHLGKIIKKLNDNLHEIAKDYGVEL